MRGAVKTVAVLTANAGREQELLELLQAMLGPSRAEIGNLRWDIWKDRDNPARWIIDAIYVDGDALQSHRRTDHYRTYAESLAGIAECVEMTWDSAEPMYDAAFMPKRGGIGM